MKLIRRQKTWLTIVILGNLVLWIVPSDVVEQIVRDRQTMLGRYSRTQFTWITVVGLISMISLYIDWGTGVAYRRRWFQVLATLLFLAPTLALADSLMRSPGSEHYVRDRLAYHRPPNDAFEFVFEDKPEAFRTYPNAPDGYGTIRCTAHTDKRGFRNRTKRGQYDVVVLGDSFAEGSKVCDEQAWPVRLAAQTGLSVYNLGMSGYAPLHYLESLEEYGLALKPRYVLCMLYEGNDFRSAKADRKSRKPSLSKRLNHYFKQSPVVGAVDGFLVNTFGPINSTGPVEGMDFLNWMPLAIPSGPHARHYAFAPKQLRDLYVSPKQFSGDKHWLNPRSLLEEMNASCTQTGAEFIVVYAPTKAHVMLPLVADDLSAEGVRRFTAISYKKSLPDPEVFFTNLIEWVGAKERVVADWCRRESIPFVGLAGFLREAAAAGTQTYFTYDQHWTPEGHEEVARRVAQVLEERRLATGTADRTR